jgi:hypothetical protein
MYYSLLGMLSIVLTTEKKQNVGGITARQGDRSKEAGFYRVGNAVLEKKSAPTESDFVLDFYRFD